MSNAAAKRVLVAPLPCRCNSTRLWAKPLQPIALGLPIVEHLARSLAQFKCVSEVRFAIAEGPGDSALADLAVRMQLAYMVGSEPDVLGRVIACARAAGATDVLRKTSEDPFFDPAQLEPAWAAHVEHANDITALDMLPEGTGFEIFTLAALEYSHTHSTSEDREHIANYARFHQAEFQLEILTPHPAVQRLDLRLTVDNPEDLIVCRRVFAALGARNRVIPLHDITEFLDAHPELTGLVQAFVHQQPTWRGLAQHPVSHHPARPHVAAHA